MVANDYDVMEFMAERLAAGDFFGMDGEVLIYDLAKAACAKFNGWGKISGGITEKFFVMAEEVAADWDAQAYDEPAIEEDYEWIRTGC